MDSSPRLSWDSQFINGRPGRVDVNDHDIHQFNLFIKWKATEQMFMIIITIIAPGFTSSSSARPPRELETGLVSFQPRQAWLPQTTFLTLEVKQFWCKKLPNLVYQKLKMHFAFFFLHISRKLCGRGYNLIKHKFLIMFQDRLDTYFSRNLNI